MFVSSLIDLHVSAVLFCFEFSSPPIHAESRTWKIRTPLSQVKLFKPPVVRELVSPSSQIKISLHPAWDLLYAEFNHLTDGS